MQKNIIKLLVITITTIFSSNMVSAAYIEPTYSHTQNSNIKFEIPSNSFSNKYKKTLISYYKQGIENYLSKDEKSRKKAIKQAQSIIILIEKKIQTDTAFCEKKHMDRIEYLYFFHGIIDAKKYSV